MKILFYDKKSSARSFCRSGRFFASILTISGLLIKIVEIQTFFVLIPFKIQHIENERQKERQRERPLYLFSVIFLPILGLFVKYSKI